MFLIVFYNYIMIIYLCLSQLWYKDEMCTISGSPWVLTHHALVLSDTKKVATEPLSPVVVRLDQTCFYSIYFFYQYIPQMLVQIKRLGNLEAKSTPWTLSCLWKLFLNNFCSVTSWINLLKEATAIREYRCQPGQQKCFGRCQSSIHVSKLGPKVSQWNIVLRSKQSRFDTQKTIVDTLWWTDNFLAEAALKFSAAMPWIRTIQISFHSQHASMNLRWPWPRWQVLTTTI